MNDPRVVKSIEEARAEVALARNELVGIAMAWFDARGQNVEAAAHAGMALEKACRKYQAASDELTRAWAQKL